MPWILALQTVTSSLAYVTNLVAYATDMLIYHFQRLILCHRLFGARMRAKRKRKMLFMLQIYPTTQTVPDLRPTIFGFAVFHNLLVCLHLFFPGCIVSYLGLVERWARENISHYLHKINTTHDSQVPFGIACRACRAFGSVVNQGANMCFVNSMLFHTV